VCPRTSCHQFLASSGRRLLSSYPLGACCALNELDWKKSKVSLQPCRRPQGLATSPGLSLLCATHTARHVAIGELFVLLSSAGLTTLPALRLESHGHVYDVGQRSHSIPRKASLSQNPLWLCPKTDCCMISADRSSASTPCVPSVACLPELFSRL
jgi:hypothetical protein